jgi:hypothetical protein
MAFTIKQIVYECQSATCSPDNRHKKMKRGDIVLMIASNIDVQIVFTSGSPFKSGETNISVPKGTIAAEFVASGASRKKYPYNLRCTNPVCAAISDPPEMIVE